LYAHPGNYLACLVITDSAGATCDFCDSVHVGNPPPVCDAHFNHYFLSNPDSIHFYPAATGSVHYLWNFDDGTTSTSRDPWHLFVQPGTYHICLIVTDTITGVSCDWCDNIVITSFHSGSSVTINPNPANRIASVSLINITDPVEIKIFDISGRLIYDNQNLTDSTFDINTEAFTDGIYYYTVRNSSEVISEGKLMIVH
jgi:PKD repeat protein